ncbi:MAG: helix-hairpin-helix domain-containing protein [Acidobacteriota bacterium]|nr:helix-hairpin-helix domain-containing protein [Acidobacteriota bacterium]
MVQFPLRRTTLKTLRWLVLILTAVCLSAAPLPQAAAAPAKKAKAEKPAAEKKPAADAKVLDINTASAEELDALPGIGKVRGAKIIKGRPYANKTQLVSKGILNQATYDKIAGKIIAKQQ